MPIRISINNDKQKHIHESFLSLYHPFVFNNVRTWYQQKHTRNIMFNGKKHQHFFVFVGGLGDLYQELHVFGVGHFIQNLPENESVLVFLVCHNPVCAEVCTVFDVRHDFYHIPYTANIFDVYEGLGHIAIPWMLYMHRKHHVLVNHYVNSYKHVNWLYDLMLPSSKIVPYKYIVLQRCAGTRDRDLPIQFAQQVIEFFTTRNIHVVHTGKHTIRGFAGGYDEPIPRINRNGDVVKNNKWDNAIVSNNPLYHYFVDQTNLKETSQLLRDSNGIVSCHSNLFLTAMQLQKSVFVWCTVKHDDSMFNFNLDNPYNAIFGSLHLTMEPQKYKYAFEDIPEVNQDNFGHML
jgi:hypothetical protein